MGYTFAAGDWMQPANDALHALLVKRAEEFSPAASVKG